MTSKAKSHLLVIGGTGFIGYHLIRLAKKKDWKVTSVSLNKPKKNRFINKVNYLKIDITKLKELKKKLKNSYTYVVNLGGYVDHDAYNTNKNKIIKAHFLGVINLTRILSNKKIKRFVQVGSGMEYGNIKAPQSENSHCLASSPYALAKLASTEFLLMLFNTKKFPATILRFFQVYGPAQDQNRILPQTIKGCMNNKKFAASKGEQIRDFCFIDDIIKAIFLALKSNKANGEILNIGSGQPQKIKNIIKTICKIVGGGKPQFGKIKYRKDENMKLYPDINKAYKILNWRPKINFKKGIKIVINSFK